MQIVQKLIDSGLLSVLYTLDGKCYLTPDQLRQEIQDELFVHNGLAMCSFTSSCTYQAVSTLWSCKRYGDSVYPHFAHVVIAIEH